MFSLRQDFKVYSAEFLFILELVFLYYFFRNLSISSKFKIYRDFLGGPVVKNPLSNAGDAGSILGWETRIPHAMGQLSPHASTTELTRLSEGARMLQTAEPTCSGAHVPQPERENPHATTREKPEPQWGPDAAKKKKKNIISIDWFIIFCIFNYLIKNLHLNYSRSIVQFFLNS